MAHPNPLFVAPSEHWTADQTAGAFAAEQGRTVVWNGDGTFSFADGVKKYRTTIMSAGPACWVFVVLPDEGLTP
jgi:hypothetical protein